MKKFKNKIILIGGASGVTKSSFSYELMIKHKIIHKLGSGFIREMAKSFISKKKNKNIYTHSFETNLKSPIQNLLLQSIPLKKMFENAINRANREGTSIIIEGVNKFPVCRNLKILTKKFYLWLGMKKHFNLINNNKTHKLRKVNNNYFKNIRLIQEELILLAKKYNWKILDRSNVL